MVCWVGPESKKTDLHQLFNSGGASSETGAGGERIQRIKLLPDSHRPALRVPCVYATASASVQARQDTGRKRSMTAAYLPGLGKRPPLFPGLAPPELKS